VLLGCFMADERMDIEILTKVPGNSTTLTASDYS
jgi:hypothetical protein